MGGILADLDEVEKAEYWLELPPLTRATAAHASRRSSTPPTPMPWSGRRATLRTLRDATARNPLLSAGPHAARGSSASSPRELLAMVREALAEMRERLADAQLRQEQESDSGDARQRKTVRSLDQQAGPAPSSPWEPLSAAAKATPEAAPCHFWLGSLLLLPPPLHPSPALQPQAASSSCLLPSTPRRPCNRRRLSSSRSRRTCARKRALSPRSPPPRRRR